jgi:pentatricopeptide repeat protein
LRLFGIGILLNVRSQLGSLLYVSLYNLQLFSAFDFFLGKKVYSSVEHRYLPVYVHFSVCVNHAACLLKVFIISFQGLCEQTVNVLQLMEEEGFEPNLVMLNLLINAFGTAGRHLEALAVFQHVKDSVCTLS